MKNPRFLRTIMYAMIIFGYIIVGVSGIVYGIEQIHPLFIAGIILTLIVVVFGAVLVRCPSSHKALLLKGQLGDYCPNCGEKI